MAKWESVVDLAGHTLGTALGLPQTVPQTNSRFDYEYYGHISSGSNGDYFSLHAPTPPFKILKLILVLAGLERSSCLILCSQETSVIADCTRRCCNSRTLARILNGKNAVRGCFCD